ncbi:MAG: hypothetical protein Q4G26_00785 [Paracoccus sp. (in: a-proteobacteria)]|nr:hypothetical protein [Paracoccus sp. (in: a-proteobacteria)]
MGIVFSIIVTLVPPSRRVASFPGRISLPPAAFDVNLPDFQAKISLMPQKWANRNRAQSGLRPCRAPALWGIAGETAGDAAPAAHAKKRD